MFNSGNQDPNSIRRCFRGTASANGGLDIPGEVTSTSLRDPLLNPDGCDMFAGSVTDPVTGDTVQSFFGLDATPESGITLSKDGGVIMIESKNICDFDDTTPDGTTMSGAHSATEFFSIRCLRDGATRRLIFRTLAAGDGITMNVCTTNAPGALHNGEYLEICSDRPTIDFDPTCSIPLVDGSDPNNLVIRGLDINGNALATSITGECVAINLDLNNAATSGQALFVPGTAAGSFDFRGLRGQGIIDVCVSASDLVVKLMVNSLHSGESVIANAAPGLIELKGHTATGVLGLTSTPTDISIGLDVVNAGTG